MTIQREKNRKTMNKFVGPFQIFFSFFFSHLILPMCAIYRKKMLPPHHPNLIFSFAVKPETNDNISCFVRTFQTHNHTVNNNFFSILKLSSEKF